MVAEKNGRVRNQKWKFTVGMVLLYTGFFAGLYERVTALLRHGFIIPEIWKEVITGGLTIWAFGVLAFGGWFLGMNVATKWSPPFKRGPDE